MKPLLVLLVALFVLTSVPVHGLPTDQGQTLFFDDFHTSQLSPNWNPVPVIPNGASQSGAGNLTQTGGWLSLTAPRPSGAPCGGSCFSANFVEANNTTPIVSASTKSQFLFMAWRVVPFNLTQIGNNPGANNAVRNAETVFGLAGSSAGGIACLCFQLVETDSVASAMMLGTSPQRETIGVAILGPMTGFQTTNNCFVNNGAGNGYMFGESWSAVWCKTTNRSAIIYSTPNNPIDLNTVHVFTMELNLQTNGSSWAAFQVDQNGWYNVTQAACSCIEGTSGVYQSLYPYINNAYCVGLSSNSCAATTPNQSLGTMVNYVLVDNYVPSTLPAGTPLPGANPIGPSGLTDTFPNFWVFEAFQIGNGIPTGTANFLMSPLYFGGFILWLITTLALCVPGFILKVKNVFVYGMIAFFSLVGNFIMGVIPLWAMGVGVAIFIGVMVKVLPTRIGDHPAGGIVD